MFALLSGPDVLILLPYVVLLWGLTLWRVIDAVAQFTGIRQNHTRDLCQRRFENASDTQLLFAPPSHPR